MQPKATNREPYFRLSVFNRRGLSHLASTPLLISSAIGEIVEKTNMSGTSVIFPGTPAPPPVLSEEDARPETPSALPDIGERPLLSGWVRLFPSTQEKGDKVMMAATDLKLHAGGVSGNGSASPLSAGRVQIDADDIIAASAITPSPPPSRRFRFTITVRRWSGELSSPRLSPPSPPSMLRRGSEGILSLLSPLWHASRASLNRSLSVARPRRQSSLMQLQIGLEYVLEFDTSWEAEAWVEAIAESREALVRAAAERRWECVGRLLRSGRLPAAREANGRGALHYACGHGDYATVMALLEAGTPVCVAGALHRTHRLRRLPRLRPCLRPAPHPRAPNLAPPSTVAPLTRRPPPSQTTPASRPLGWQLSSRTLTSSSCSSSTAPTPPRPYVRANSRASIRSTWRASLALRVARRRCFVTRGSRSCPSSSACESPLSSRRSPWCSSRRPRRSGVISC